MKDHTHILRLTFAALFAALIMLTTIVIVIPVGAGAYFNLGDSMIYAAAWFLGPLAGVAAAVGSGLADVISGYVIYAPATLIIKGLMGFVVGVLLKHFNQKLMSKIMALSAGALIMIVGYFAYEYFAATLLEIPKVAAFGNILGNLVQGVAGVVIGTLVISALGKIKGINEFAAKIKEKK